ncbi:MFS transporter [Nocardia salmonicida]|uniref:MFS transporter n=1 Tax=Nocardia salmonicida TaxID=53431 RepID=UPI000A003B9C|nr:MFS transporter [Nocardia salmonicida]
MSNSIALQANSSANRREFLTLAGLLVCQLMIIVDVTVMNVALPQIKSDLNFSPTGLSWVIDAYTLVFGGLLLLGGRAGDLLGRHRVFIVGVSLFTIASLVGGLAQEPVCLIVARVTQGVGAALAGPNALALLATLFTERKARMKALALYSGMAGAGFTLGLVVGGLLTEWLTWRSVLFINGPLGGFALVATLRRLPFVPRNPGRLDLPGAMTATAGVAMLVYGFIRAGSHGWNDPAAGGALSLGAILAVIFLVIEHNSAQPMLPLRLFADRNRAAAYSTAFVGYMGSMSMFFFMTLYLQEALDMGPLATGIAFLPTALLMLAIMRINPYVLERFGPRRVTMVGALLLIAGLILPTQLSTETSYFPLVLLTVTLMGCGTGLTLMPLSIIVMTDIPSDLAGVAGGALQTVQQTGASVGLAVLITVFGGSTRHVAASPEQVLVDGVTSAFEVAAVMGVLTFLGTLMFRRSRTDNLRKDER